MKKKALTLAIAAALSAPASFAATDDSGMRYTSASEGFYASLRVQFQTKTTKGGKASIGNEGSRIGIRGTNDMGGGLEGFYRWESEVSIRDGDKSNEKNTIRTRLGNVGLRGAFGQIQLGSFWTADYNWVGVVTDRAGITTPYYVTEREGRSESALEYTTPDLNGFHGAIRVSARPDGVTDKNTLDLWNIAARYATHGFTVAASYNNTNDAFDSADGSNPVTTGGDTLAGTSDYKGGDMKSWSAALTYAQDNWDVGMLYTVDNTSDDKGGVAGVMGGRDGCGIAADVRPATPTFTNSSNGKKCKDRTTLGVAGGVSIDKVRIIAGWEKQEQADGAEDVSGGVEVQYKFTANSQVDARYQIVDQDTDKDAENNFRVVMRHNF